jgi:hypothetical protein
MDVCTKTSARLSCSELDQLITPTVSKVISSVKGEIDLRERFFKNNPEKSEHEAENRRVRGVLIRERNRYEESRGKQDPSSCDKAHWLDRFVRGLLIDFIRVTDDLVERRLTTPDLEYTQESPSPIMFSDKLVALAAVRAIRDLKALNDEADKQTVIHALGDFVKLALYQFRSLRGQLYKGETYIPEPQVPKDYQAILSFLKSMDK